MSADPPQQPLVEHQFNRRSDSRMVMTQNEQPFKNPFARTCVERGNHQVPSERSPHSEIGCLFVANLANHEHLGILPQQMACGFREIESLRLINFRLHHPWY